MSHSFDKFMTIDYLLSYIQVTSFIISGTTSGSITSYMIYYSGDNMQREVACMREDSCEYTVEIPPTICATSSEVDVYVAAANRFGFGPSSEVTAIGMTLIGPFSICN